KLLPRAFEPGRARTAIWALIASLTAPPCAHGVTNIWSNPVPGPNNWSAPANWAAGTPTTGDDVKFFDLGGTAISNINNVIDPGYSGVVSSLQYGSTNGSHTT